MNEELDEYEEDGTEKLLKIFLWVIILAGTMLIFSFLGAIATILLRGVRITIG